MRTLKALCAVAALSTTAIVALSLSAEARCAYGGCKGPIVGTKVNTSYNYNTVRHVTECDALQGHLPATPSGEHQSHCDRDPSPAGDPRE